jgi:hypothetical protein
MSKVLIYSGTARHARNKRSKIIDFYPPDLILFYLFTCGSSGFLFYQCPSVADGIRTKSLRQNFREF